MGVGGAAGGRPWGDAPCPASKAMRSLVKARSLSLAASTLAKSGMRCRSSTSSRILTPGTSRSLSATSLGLDELAERRARAIELGDAALLDEVPILQHQDPVEMPRQARPVQDPDEAALGAGLLH